MLSRVATRMEPTTLPPETTVRAYTFRDGTSVRYGMVGRFLSLKDQLIRVVSAWPQTDNRRADAALPPWIRLKMLAPVVFDPMACGDLSRSKNPSIRCPLATVAVALAK